MDTQAIHYRVARRAALARRQQAIRHLGKSVAVLAFVALISVGIMRVSLLTYTHGAAGVSMFASEAVDLATQLSARANAASNSFNAKVIASIEQAQYSVVARDLAIADSITTASQETIALATGSDTASANQTPEVATSSAKLATKAEEETPKQQGAKTESSEKAKSSEDKPAQTKAETPAETPATGPPAIAALPDFRSNAKPPASKQVNTTGGYAYGQCTYYVAGRRQVGLRWGNARTWMSAAQREGYLTGKIPVPGAVAWTPNGWYGHVAYVERVEGDQVLISEMNFAGWNRVSQRWVAASSFSYIYGKS